MFWGLISGVGARIIQDIIGTVANHKSKKLELAHELEIQRQNQEFISQQNDQLATLESLKLQQEQEKTKQEQFKLESHESSQEMVRMKEISKTSFIELKYFTDLQSSWYKFLNCIICFTNCFNAAARNIIGLLVGFLLFYIVGFCDNVEEHVITSVIFLVEAVFSYYFYVPVKNATGKIISTSKK